MSHSEGVDEYTPCRDVDGLAAVRILISPYKPLVLHITIDNYISECTTRTILCEEDSPRSAPDELDEPGGETATPGELQDHHESPKDDGKLRDDATTASCRETGPGGYLGE